MCRRSILPTLMLVVTGGLGSVALAAPDAGERCRMVKLSAAGAHARELLRCHVRGIRVALPAVPACLAAADAKLARSFARAEARATCPPSLAAAHAASAGFVAELLAVAAPTPVPTPSPTPSPSPMFTGCGNGVVEAGEQCDGQAYCAPSCTFALPTVCCESTGFCADGPFPATADQCFLSGVPFTLGAACELISPDCEPAHACGICVPEATFPVTSVCCQHAASCTDDTIEDTVELWRFVFQGCLQVGGSSVTLGTCGGAACVPGG